jgi:glucokinase
VNEADPHNLCKKVIAIDVGGTKISGGIVNESGEVEFFTKHATNKEGGYKVVNQIVQIIEYLMSKVENLNHLVGVGISIPGIVNNGIVVMTLNVQNWENIALVELLKSKLKKEIPILLIDDRVAVALGEYWLGAAKNRKNVAVIIVGTGVGAGIIFDGQPYFGSSGVSGAIGWWITDKKELNKETRKGFLEEKIAGPGIAKEAITKLKKHKIETLLIDMCKNNLDQITSEMIFDAAKKGDSFAKKIVENAAVSLGITVSNVVSILNPEIVVITGGVGKEFVIFSETINEIVKKFSQPHGVKNVEIVFSDIGYYAYLLGTAKYVLEKVSK